MREKRKTQRFNIDYAVSWTNRNFQAIQDGKLSNLSIQGGGIKGSFGVEAETEMALCIHTVDSTAPIIIDLAKIRWVDRQEFGTEFILISRPKEKRRLAELLESLSKIEEPH